jgi:hypothetical protein
VGLGEGGLPAAPVDEGTDTGDDATRCVLAYHLLAALEKRGLDQGVHTSWATLREQLSTHEVMRPVRTWSGPNV